MTGRSLGLGESTTGHGASGANGSLNADSRVVSPCLLVGPPLVECRKRYPLEDHVAGYIDCWNPPRRSVTIEVAGVGGCQGLPVSASRRAVRMSWPYLPTVEMLAAVSYTHLRAHETDSYLVCR